MNRFRSTAVDLLLLAGATTACADDAASTTAEPATAPSTTVPSAATPAPTTLVEAPGTGSEFCAVNDQLDAGAETALSADSTPADVQAFFEVLFPEKFTEMKAAAPDDLVDDMDILGAGFTSLGQLFAANEWNLAAAFEDPALGVLLDDPAYVAAGTAVDAYCGE